MQTGQAWVSLTSPSEGTSRVTAFVPALTGWELRQQTATIYWVDAQWQLPAPAISPVGGRNTLITTVSRQSTGTPLPGWHVRYEISGGPAAGFGPDAAQSIEVVTSDTGQAAAEIVQSQPAAGTNQISISIIQPVASPGQNQPLTVGAGSVLQTWADAGVPTATLETQPSPAVAPPTFQPTPTPAQTPSPPSTPAEATLEVHVDGPTSATLGDSVQFQIQVTNRGTGVASGLLVTDRFDAGLEHARSQESIARDLVDLQPGAMAQLTVNFRVTQPGELCQSIDVTGAGGLNATTRHCLTATSPPIGQPAPGEQRWEPDAPAAQPIPVQPPSDQPPSRATCAGRRRDAWWFA